MARTAGTPHKDSEGHVDMNAWLVVAAAGQAGLTAVAQIRLALQRIPAVLSGEADPRAVANDPESYPQRTLKYARNLTNQYESPVLFLACIAVALAAGLSGPVLVGLAYAWLVTRAAHMAIHTGSNDVRLRFLAFAAGFVILLAMWGVLAVAAITG